MTTKSFKKILVIFCVVVLAIAAAGAYSYFTSASYRRHLKDFQSDYTGGLNRTITAYSATGEKLGEWSGKIDVEISDQKVKFDLNGKRTIIYNAAVIIQEE